MKGREITRALREGRPIFSSAMVSISPLWPNLVKQSGVDFVFVDTEHTPTDRLTLSWICQTYQALELPPVVRIPSNDPFEACKALDAGAAGVIGPYIETADQVRGLVGAVKLSPLKGERLRQALEDHQSLEPQLRDYLQQRNGDKILIANIESRPAIENLSEICAVEGLDAVLIGPHDLSCSLGIPEQYDHPEFGQAVQTVLQIARKHRKGAGIHFWQSLDREIEWSKSGANLIMHSSDLAMFSNTLRNDIQRLRAAIENVDASRSAG